MTMPVPVTLVERLANVLERIESRLAPQESAAPGGLLKIEDVAARLRRSRRYVERLVKKGSLKKVPNLGPRTTRFRAADVERLMADREDRPGRRRL